jgi:DNA helicase HerA-like ATPase
MSQTLTSDDMHFHMLVVGGTGSGKTNAVLYMLKLLFDKKEAGKPQPALFLFDPGGDASIDLLRAILKAEWNSRVAVLDPQYVSFGFNLLSLPEGLTQDEKAEVLQTQVEEFAVLLSDVFNTDASNAPRLMWIFKGALYYLYTFTDDPTLWDLYNLMLQFTKESPAEVETLLRQRVKDVEIIRETIGAISKLSKEAYMPVLNRISNFVLPPSSVTFRTFCSRKSTIDLEKRMEPGRLTIFRIPSSLPNEFRRILASAVVMKLYFASLKRAKRLERAGEQPVARTPVILAADEFRDIAQLKILRTVLSQSRKYGLYLWMVAQTLSEIPDDLMSSIQSNVGSILAFRGSPDDARKLAKLLHPRKTETVESIIPALEDYAAVVRKRPVGGKPTEPPFRVTFPKLRDPMADFAECIGYIKADMEKLYGGTAGDTSLVFKEELKKAQEARGDCPLGGPLHWMPLAYLHRIGTEISFRQMADIFEQRCGWEGSILQAGLNYLSDRAYAKAEVKPGQLYLGIDPGTGQPMWKEPETEAEKMQARQVFYSIAEAAQEAFFRFDLDKWKKSGRVGGPLHVKAMLALLEEFWEKGYWCAFDRGDREGPFPDILYSEPFVIKGRGKEGRIVGRISTDEWEKKRNAVEVEITPSKNPQQVRENYAKNYTLYQWATFVVVSRAQITDVREILADKDKATYDVVYKPIGLPEDELKKLIDQGDVGPVRASPEVSQGLPPASPVRPSDLHENELHLLSLMLSFGYRNKGLLASDLDVDERTVARYLGHLKDLGLVQKEGNGYWLMQEGRKLAEGWRASGSPHKQARLS